MSMLMTLAATAETATLPGAGPGLQAIFSTTTYIIAGVCFILSLKWLSAPTTARRGNIVGQIGMAAAIIGALLQHNIVSYEWIIVGLVLADLVDPMVAWLARLAASLITLMLLIRYLGGVSGKHSIIIAVVFSILINALLFGLTMMLSK